MEVSVSPYALYKFHTKITLGNASNHEDGAFAEYVTAKGDIQMKVPDNVSFEGAATLGAGIITMGQHLYQSLGLPPPETNSASGDTNIAVLIYSGSTATGSLAIQFAKLSVTLSHRRYNMAN